MKFLALILLLGLVSAQEDCQSCKASVKTLFDSLQTFDEILAAAQALVNIVCLQLPDEAHESCATGMYSWYPVVTKALFEYQGFTDGICSGIGLCESQLTGVSIICLQINIHAFFSSFGFRNCQKTVTTVSISSMKYQL